MTSTTAIADARAFGALCDDVAACARCLRVGYSHVLSRGNGPLDAAVLFVAEAPGRRGAARTAIPLDGDESGGRFNAFLDLARLHRADAFVTNAVLCNPINTACNNRTPLSSEVANCRGFLERTLEVVRAPLVVALGRVALDALDVIKPHGLSLERDTARPVAWRGRTLVALYHPSRQSTLHRPHDAQEDDWRALAVIAAGLSLSPASLDR